MTNNREIYRRYWWQFAEKRRALHAAIASLKHVLVRAEAANIHSMAFVPTTITFSNKLCVFTYDHFSYFAILQSAFHEEWARYYAPTMRTDMSYSISDCFETFPLPAILPALEDIGKSYYELRRGIMLDRQEGLTKTYNRFHNAEETSEDIQRLRDLHANMDRAVAAAYGWPDLDLAHGLRETKQGVRFTISEPARREVLARLLKLNHDRYAEEVKQGLHDKNRAAKGKRRGAKKRASSSAPDLFD